MTKKKPATQKISKIERTKFERMFSEDPLVNLVNESLWGFSDNYHLDESAEIFKIEYTPRNRIPTRILKLGLLKEYARSEPYISNPDVLKPVYVSDNHYGGNVGFVMLFDNPKRGENVSRIEMGIGFHESDIICSSRLFDGQLWPWARGHIYVKMQDEKPETELYFNGIECSTNEYALRGLALRLYRCILDGVMENGEQKEGMIHHRYAKYDAPRIIDTGGIRVSLRGL